jgi:hypothetical protein
MTRGYKLTVYKLDRRCKDGKRLVNSYAYESHDEAAMAREVADLKSNLYKEIDGWELVVTPLTVMVTSLVSGKLVEIRYEDQGTACDPSMERFWSM